jgi:hypothetical protein
VGSTSVLSGDHPDNHLETCAGCGIKGYPHNPLRWKIEYDLDLPGDHYCDNCYREFRKTEFAEEATIRAIKTARLDQIFTLTELQRAMDGICGLEPEPFAKAIQQGHHNLIAARSADELRAVYGPLVDIDRDSSTQNGLNLD